MRFILFVICCLACSAGLSQTFAPRYELIKIKEVNTAYHEAAPVVSPDGKKLYFFVVDHPSNTFGKTGTQDIWMSTKDDKGVWSPPQHLGPPFNQSKANQVFQVLHDGTLLVRGGRSKNEIGYSLSKTSIYIFIILLYLLKTLHKRRINPIILYFLHLIL